MHSRDFTLYDISLPISPAMVLYPGDPAPNLSTIMSINRGDPLNAAHLSIGCHIGTHVDAPYHFLNEGSKLQDLPLHRFFGPCIVICPATNDVIRSIDLVQLAIPPKHHVILKTNNSRFLRDPNFYPSYTYLERDAAEYLLKFSPQSVGFDYYSLDSADSTDFPTHTLLARHDVPVFVCLDLASVDPGCYWLAAFPLALLAGDGSPVRAVLIKFHEEAEL